MTYRARCAAKKERLGRRLVTVWEVWGPNGEHSILAPEKVRRDVTRLATLVHEMAYAASGITPIEPKSREELEATFGPNA